MLNAPEESVAKETPPSVIYEDEGIMVIDKPAGWLVHSAGGDTARPTVVDWFLGLVPSAHGVGEAAHTMDGLPIERSGVVHRLDSETSGIMVMAKTQDAHALLKKQFHDRTVRKEYRAFVYGRVNDKYGTINRAIGRHPRDFKQRSAENGAKEPLREALTHFERIGVGEWGGESFSYLKLLPKTGRTHQLRVHLKAIGRPIVGDQMYAPKLTNDSNNLSLRRLALHAHILELNLPAGARERFISLVPPDFEQAAERIAE